MTDRRSVQPLSVDNYEDLREKVVELTKEMKEAGKETPKEMHYTVLALAATCVVLLDEVWFLRNSIEVLTEARE